MKLAEARKSYSDLSGKLSDVVRQLSFAGVAVVWIFRQSSDPSKVAIPADLIWPLIFFVFALASDLCHYLYGSVAWSNFAHQQGKAGKKDEDEVFPDEKINWPSLVFFYLKAVACAIAYALVLCYLKGKL